MPRDFHKSEFGYGVFTTADVAAILNQSRQKVYAYIEKYGDERFGKKLFNQTYSWEVGGYKVINFLGLIELAVFFLLRDEYRLPVNKINEAREIMAKATNEPYPFATNEVLTDKKNIYYGHLGSLLNADKKHKDQTNFKEIVAPLLDKIHFDGNTATMYYPLGKGSDVVVDPQHQFGQPTIKNTNIRIDTLGKMHGSGESIHSLQSLYDLTEKQVEDALLYYKKAA